MTQSPLCYVVDASVGIKLFVEEEFSEQAHALFSCLAADPPAELYVPDLFYIECTNILLKYTTQILSQKNRDKMNNSQKSFKGKILTHVCSISLVKTSVK